MVASQLSSPLFSELRIKGRVLEPNCTTAEKGVLTHGRTTGPFLCSFTAVQMDGAVHGWTDGKSSISSGWSDGKIIRLFQLRR